MVHEFPSTHEQRSLILYLCYNIFHFVITKPNAHLIFITTIAWASPSKMASKMGFTITTPKFFNAPFRKPFIYASSSPCSTRAHQTIHFIRRNHLPIRRVILLSPKATTDQPGLSIFGMYWLIRWMIGEIFEVLGGGLPVHD